MKKIILLVFLLVAVGATAQVDNFYADTVTARDVKGYMRTPDSVKYVSPLFLMNTGKYFSTIQAAINGSSRGTAIVIYPQVNSYQENLVIKSGVALIFMPGAVLSGTGSGTLMEIPYESNNVIRGLNISVNNVDAEQIFKIGGNDTLDMEIDNLNFRGTDLVKALISTVSYYNTIDIRIKNLNLYDQVDKLLDRNGILTLPDDARYNIEIDNLLLSNGILNIYNYFDLCNLNIKNIYGGFEVALTPLRGKFIFNNGYSQNRVSVVSYNSSVSEISCNNISLIASHNLSGLTIKGNDIDNVVSSDTSSVIILNNIFCGAVESNDKSSLNINSDTIYTTATSNGYSNMVVAANVINSHVIANDFSNQTITSHKANVASNSSGGTQIINVNVLGAAENYGTGKQFVTADIINGNCINNVATNSATQTINASIINNQVLNFLGTQYVTCGEINSIADGIYNSGKQFVNIGKINVDNGVFSAYSAVGGGLNGETYGSIGEILSSKNIIMGFNNFKVTLKIGSCELTNDSGHVLRGVNNSEFNITFGKIKSAATTYAAIYLFNTAKFTGLFLDSVNSGGGSAIEVNSGCVANITGSYFINSSPLIQTVVWYGSGILKADIIENLADSVATIDSQSQDFLIKGARIKGDTPGGVVAIGVNNGLILDECRIINLNSGGYSIDSYSGNRQITIYNLYSTTAANSANCELIVGTATVDPNVK